MKKVDSVLFDLDDTLVSTSSLEPFRTSGDYKGLMENISKSKIYDPTKHILQTIKEMKIPLGLVTNAPRWYVTEVLKYHDINVFDVIVSYDDVPKGGTKPSPLGIEIALQELGLDYHSNSIYIGDLDTDFIAAYTAGIKPIAPSWAKRAPINQVPAACISSHTLLSSLNDYDSLSLIGDQTANMRSFNFPKKQLNFLPLNEKGELVPLNKEDIKLIALGRYFSQNNTLTASLHENHQLSKDIFAKELSSSYTVPQYYVNLISRTVETLPEYAFSEPDAHFDIITVVPSKKEKTPRLENMLNRISSQANSKSEFITDLFEFASGAQSLKSLGGKEARLGELQTTLQIKSKYLPRIAGKTILVIDDVITTGATFQHAFSLLSNAGATFYFGMCLAKTVSVREDTKLCPICGRVMNIRTNSKNGIHFYGCSGFYEKVSPCKHTEAIKVKDCPKCDGHLVKNYSDYKKSYFLGCSNFRERPSCKHTENVEEL